MRVAIVLAATAFAALTACSNYDVTFNDTLVYGPKSLFRDFDVADSALADCLSQAIEDNRISDPADLTSLNCSDAGIGDLTGLAHFSGLQQLKLSNNRIRNLMELARLTSLKALWLDGNAIIDPVPLYQLEQLQQLDLDKNPGLQCPRPTRLDHLTSLGLPAHCRSE